MTPYLLSTLILFSAAAQAEAAPCTLDAEKTLTVYANNVGIFPEFLRVYYPEKLKKKKSAIIANEAERADALAQVLLSLDAGPDVLMLQEIWSITARDILKTQLKPSYPHCAHPEAIGLAPMQMQPSGLMIFSKHPIEEFGFREFTQAAGWEQWARKGVLGARMTVEGQRLALFTTHLQAGDKKAPEVKRSQLRECNAFIREFANSPEATLILAGDFNIDSTNPATYGMILEELPGARDTFRDACSALKKTARFSDIPNKRIDYILVFGETKALSTIIDPAGKAISDHLAVLGDISLGQ